MIHMVILQHCIRRRVGRFETRYTDYSLNQIKNRLKQIARKFIDFEKYTCVNICSLYPYLRSVVEEAKPRYDMYINCFNLY